MNRLLTGHRHRRNKHGAAMVEALLSYFVLFLVLFGMLHIFYFFAGQFFADYSALRGARSRAVGFADYLVKRESRVSAIGGSGLMVYPGLHNADIDEKSEYAADQFTQEKTLIQRYRTGITWLEYEFWYGNSANPNHGVTTHLDLSVSDSDRESKMTTIFRNYSMPMSSARVEKDGNGNILRDSNGNPSTKGFRLFFRRGIDLKGSASLANHAKVYLED
ncbi:MAG: hypothetical protein IJH79_12070 [Lentisphaeria bacterium]|nr:hypothetical protein [Lentisphaeria bacterium]